MYKYRRIVTTSSSTFNSLQYACFCRPIHMFLIFSIERTTLSYTQTGVQCTKIYTRRYSTRVFFCFFFFRFFSRRRFYYSHTLLFCRLLFLLWFPRSVFAQILFRQNVQNSNAARRPRKYINFSFWCAADIENRDAFQNREPAVSITF